MTAFVHGPKGNEPSAARCKLLAIGSCLINGYPFRQQDSFLSVACDALRDAGCELEVERFGPTKLDHADRIRIILESTRPDVVLLQLGGYETIQLLEDVIRGWVGLKIPKRVTDQHLHTSPFRTPEAYRKWRMLMAVKYLADTALLHPIIKPEHFRRQLRLVLELIQGFVGKRALVMGNMPTVDPMVDGYRNRLAPVFEEETVRAGLAFLSVRRKWKEDRCDRSLLHDPFHFNPEGHRWLAAHTVAAFETSKILGQPVSYSARGSAR